MSEPALRLAGHTHPRPLAEAFLRLLQERSAARSVALYCEGPSDDGADAGDTLYAIWQDPQPGLPAVESELRLAVPEVGYVVLRGSVGGFSPSALSSTLALFALSFRACMANEREHRVLRERELAARLALQARTALVAEVRDKAQPLLASLGECATSAAPTLQALQRLLAALPAAEADDEAARRALPHRAPLARRVLLVEDFPPLRMLFRMQLETLGFEVDEAADGAEGLRRWIAQRHDLVLTDLQMPALDGLGLTRAIRFHEGDGDGRRPVIGITGASDDETLQRCREAGMSDVLVKPIDLGMLARTLGRFTAEALPDQAAADPPAEGDEVLDLPRLRRSLGGLRGEEIVAIVTTFQKSAAEGLQALRAAPSPSALRDEMHRQKSGARSIGALRYARLAESIEARLRRGEALDLPAQLAELDAALADLRRRSAELDAVMLTVAPAAPAAVPRRSLAVLVVDDDPVIRLQLRSQLAALGVDTVQEAGDGMQARACLVRGGPFDLVFCDLNMPGMDGVELLRDLGRDRFAGAVALMSGEDSAVIATAASLAALHGLTVVARLQKPLSQDAVEGVLEAVGAAVVTPRPPRGEDIISADDLRRGIAGGEFRVQLQPQVDIATLRPVGVEALARWTLDDGRAVPPDRFIVAAERCGMIHALSEVLVREALRSGAALRRAGCPQRLSVNLSALWLDRLDLPDRLCALCAEAGLAPDEVVLEVTETGVARDLASALDVLTRLRLRGFGLSIDDFGVGYSSFERLRRIPFTELKLDRSYVSQSGADEAARAILESTMRIASRLNLASVAEGVETDADLAVVRGLGCRVAQGYLFARPMEVADTIAWLRERDGTPQQA